MSEIPTFARNSGSPIWHYLNRGAATYRTMCGKEAGLMARFNAADLPSGERNGRICEKCRKATEPASFDSRYRR